MGRFEGRAKINKVMLSQKIKQTFSPREQFNIKHKDAGAMIKIVIDWEFLKDQEESRKFTMAGVGRELAKEKRTFIQKANEIQQAKKDEDEGSSKCLG